MRRYVLDAGILGDYIYRRHSVDQIVNEHRLLGHYVGTTIPTVGEVHFGAYASNDPGRHIVHIKRRLSAMVFWPFTIEAADKYGELAAFLKSTGQAVQQIDVQVAAIALTLGNCTVVTTDSDFNRIPGLSVENWRLATTG